MPSKPVTVATVATVDLAVVGDVLPMNVANPFADDGVRGALKSADITFANLECPLSTRGTPTPMKYGGQRSLLYREWVFRASPRAAVSLRNAGVDVVSLANNHMLDYGPVALNDTLTALGRNGIRAVGAGRNLAAARRHAVVTRRGIRVAFLVYAEENTLPNTFTFEAAPRRPGMAFVREGAPGQPDAVTRQTFIDDVAAARKDADIVAVSFHWGIEFQARPSRFQKGLARSAIDAGANLVIGHHPHCLQGIENYKGRPIFYSLGNFVFKSGYDICNRSGIARVTLDKRGVRKVLFQPVWVQGARPRWNHQRATESARVLNTLSRDLGTSSVMAKFKGRPVTRIDFRGATGKEPAKRSKKSVKTKAHATSRPIFAIAAPPPGFVDIGKTVPGIVVDLPYAGDRNVFKTRFYAGNHCLLRVGTARKLTKAQQFIARYGLRLKVWDGYRPPAVQRRMWNQVRDTRYIANPANGGSNHNRGAAVDVTLVQRDGRAVAMPTGFDDFSAKAHASYAGGAPAARRNRELLRRAMTAAGFTQLSTEWWHFDDREASR